MLADLGDSPSPRGSDDNDWERWGLESRGNQQQPAEGSTRSGSSAEQEPYEAPPSGTDTYYRGAGYDNVLLDLMVKHPTTDYSKHERNNNHNEMPGVLKNDFLPGGHSYDHRHN